VLVPVLSVADQNIGVITKKSSTRTLHSKLYRYMRSDINHNNVRGREGTQNCNLHFMVAARISEPRTTFLYGTVRLQLSPRTGIRPLETVMGIQNRRGHRTGRKQRGRHSNGTRVSCDHLASSYYLDASNDCRPRWVVGWKL
jgi:hypothetical protein